MCLHFTDRLYEVCRRWQLSLLHQECSSLWETFGEKAFSICCSFCCGWHRWVWYEIKMEYETLFKQYSYKHPDIKEGCHRFSFQSSLSFHVGAKTRSRRAEVIGTAPVAGRSCFGNVTLRCTCLNNTVRMIYLLSLDFALIFNSFL